MKPITITTKTREATAWEDVEHTYTLDEIIDIFATDGSDCLVMQLVRIIQQQQKEIEGFEALKEAIKRIKEE